VKGRTRALSSTMATDSEGSMVNAWRGKELSGREGTTDKGLDLVAPVNKE